VLACGIAAVVVALPSFVVGTPERTEARWGAGGRLSRLGLVTGSRLLMGPLWTMRVRQRRAGRLGGLVLLAGSRGREKA
jgi:hypothetical protein